MNDLWCNRRASGHRKTHTETNGTCTSVAGKDELPSSGAAAADCLLFQIAAEMSPPLSGARLSQHMCRRPGWLTPQMAGEEKKKKRQDEETCEALSFQYFCIETMQQCRADAEGRTDNRLTEVGEGRLGGSGGGCKVRGKTKGDTAERRGG